MATPVHHTAFLLAAGFGTRLRPLTLHRPKALLPICGVPMLDHALAHVRAHGHRAVLVNAHHLWEQVTAWVVTAGEAHPDLHLEVQVELPDILGTGGGLRAARDRLAERFVVLNADILCDVDLTALLAAAPDGGAAMALRDLPVGESISRVEADAEGVVVAIEGVVSAPSDRPPTHFTGVHALHRATLDLVPDDGLQCIIRTAYRAIVPQRRVRALHHAGAWVDIGRPDEYLAANLAVLDGTLRPPVDPWTRGGRGPTGCWVGPDATVHGSVRRSVVGAGATIPDGADLVDCVVWDGCTAPAARLRRAVVHDGGVLELAPTAR